MPRVDEIIKRARDTLAEKTPNRWKTDRLLRALSEGQKKIAQETLCIRESCTIQLCSGYHTYKLDTTNVVTEGGIAVAISAVRNHKDDTCRFVTTSIMNELASDWRTKNSDDITHIIYNKQKPLIFRVYPTPLTAEVTEVGASLNITDEPFAKAATICEVIAIPSNFDIITEKAPIKMLVEFFHTPPAITTIEDTNLLIPEYFDIALKHYITGMVLRDDLDKQNRSFGIEELQLFNAQYEFAKSLIDRDFVDQKEEHYAPVGYNAEIK